MIQSKTKVQTSDRIHEDQTGTSGQVDRQGHQKVRSLSPNDVKHWSTLCLDTSSRDDGLHLGFWSLSTKTGDTDRMWHHRGSGYRKWSDLSSDLRQAAAGVSTSHLLTFPGTRCSELTQEMKTTPTGWGSIPSQRLSVVPKLGAGPVAARHIYFNCNIFCATETWLVHTAVTHLLWRLRRSHCPSEKQKTPWRTLRLQHQ